MSRAQGSDPPPGLRPGTGSRGGAGLGSRGEVFFGGPEPPLGRAVETLMHRPPRPRRRAIPLIPALAAVTPLLLAGCVIPFNGPGDIKRDVQRISGNDLDSRFSMTVGRSAIAFARWVTREDDDTELLEGLRKVEIGIYEVDDPLESERSPLSPALWPEWTPMVEIHAPSEGPDDGPAEVLVLLQPGKGEMERILLIVEQDTEVVIVRVTGDLDRMIEAVLTMALEDANHPELVEPTLVAWRDQDHEETAPDSGSPPTPPAL